MFPKAKRLTKPYEIDRVFKKGNKIYTALFKILVTENSNEFNRFLVIISKKQAKKAVDRNKIRRRITEFFRLEIDPLIKGYDIVIVAGKVNDKTTYAEIEASGKEFIEKFKIKVIA